MQMFIQRKIYQKYKKYNFKQKKKKTLQKKLQKRLKRQNKTLIKSKIIAIIQDFFGLDELTDGLHRGELTIVGARPGVGKTTFSLQIAEYIAQKQKSVAYICLEMSSEQMIQKMIAKEARINSRKIRNGDLQDNEINKIAQACIKVSNLKMNILTKVRTIQQIEIIARRMKNRNKLDLLIIDYLQLVRSNIKSQSREQEVADISRTLKLLSIELEIPIIALCQLNRNASKNEPTLADIRESGSIEQDADNVIFLYQEDVENNIVTVDLQKQRAGNIGKSRLKFNKVNSEFVNLER